jgi:hypothetical protein
MTMKRINADKLDTRRVRCPMPKAGPKDRFRSTGTPAVPRGADSFPQMRKGARSK